MQKIIIGITGLTGSGKDTVADYLVKKGFLYSSLSDCIRDECAKKQINMDRDNLIIMGNQLRKEHGPNVLAERALQKIKNLNSQKFVLVSIRNLEELNYLKQQGGLKLIVVETPIKVRYERNMARGRTEDSVTFEEFEMQEDKERNGGEKEQQLDKVIEQADYTVDNSEKPENTYMRVDKILEKI
ncbi:MAG: AAA family ATPase [Candidatus Kuenenbacteria bacterium]